MRPLAGDFDVEEGPAGRTGAAAKGELSNRHARAVVHAVDGVARKPLEQPVLQHRQRTAGAFLGGLEDEIDGAVEIAGLRQVLRGTKQHGGVAVVAAGVHAAGVLADVGDVVDLQHRQRVHVRAQPD